MTLQEIRSPARTRAAGADAALVPWLASNMAAKSSPPSGEGADEGTGCLDALAEGLFVGIVGPVETGVSRLEIGSRFLSQTRCVYSIAGVGQSRQTPPSRETDEHADPETFCTPRGAFDLCSL